MYRDTITLFNRYTSRATGSTWYATVLHNVHVNMDKAAILAKYGPESQDSATLNVRYTVENGNIMIGGKRWLPPKEWDRQANDDYAKTITFADGVDFDIFILGEWTGDAVVFDSDYAMDNGFYNYLNSREDYVFAISSVGGPYTAIPHFEIMGK